MRGLSGTLIAFEGLDQSGKETQARRLRARLEAAGRAVAAIAFPRYETPISEEIARALAGERHYTPEVLQLLFIVNRYEGRPAMLDWLAAGRIVLCDLYLASSIAYGEAQGLDPGWIADVQRQLPQPAITLYLDIAPETAMQRKAAGRDRFERDVAQLDRVRASYLRQTSSPGWYRIDGEQPIDAVGADILRVIHAQPGLLSVP
jgi:dTMP kinase